MSMATPLAGNSFVVQKMIMKSTTANKKKPIIEKGPWFKTWFDSSFYHQLYSNRNEEEAGHFIQELIAEFKPSQDSVMLDLGCGSGRHSRILADKGFRVTGIDLALSSIMLAKRSSHDGLQFHQHDMRKPFGENRYDYVFNFFTSFGYFKEDAENHLVVDNIFRSLKPGGLLMMDYLNVQFADDLLIPFETREIDGIEYKLSRWTDETHFYKKITIDINEGEPVEFTEQVLRYGLSDFHDLFFQHGLTIEKVFGDYDLHAYDRKSSPRLIMVARKAS